MPLATHVTNRYSAQRLVNLTNPDSPASVAANTARLDLAVADATAEFETVCGVAYDDTNAQHIGVAVQGVEYYLYSYGISTKDAAIVLYDKWLERLKLLARVTGRRWISPVTTSNLVPSRETTSPEVAPEFERDHMAAFRPNAPRTGGSSGSRD